MSKQPDQTTKQPASAEMIDKAINAGKGIIADNKPKIEAAMSIYIALLGETQDTVVSAFIKGAALTPKGAVTYWYNCRRKHNRMKAAAAK